MKIRQALIEQAPSLELQRAAAAEIARLDAALAEAERRLALQARPTAGAAGVGLEDLVRAVAQEWGAGGLGPDTMYGELAVVVAQRAVAAERERCIAAIRNVQTAYDEKNGPGPSIEASVCSDCIGAING